MQKVLNDLKETKVVRVTGSYADGTQTENSDIDFYVKEDRPYPVPKVTNIQKVIAVLKKHGIMWRSDFPGYIFTHLTAGNGCLPTQMEFSDFYKPREGRMKEVVISDVQFKTY